MKAHVNTEKEVLRVYKKVNPSNYLIEKRPKVYKEREKFVTNLFLHRLNFLQKCSRMPVFLSSGVGQGSIPFFISSGVLSALLSR